MIRINLIICCIVFLTQCGSGNKSSSNQNSSQSSSSAPLQMHVEFNRISNKSDGSFAVLAWLTDSNNQIVAFPNAVNFSATRGSISTPALNSAGKTFVTVTPDALGTGEYPISVKAKVQGSDKQISRTALVMGAVDSQWNQPMMIEGSVNTLGTQDSAAISPDGKYLFLQYYPVTINCVIEGDNTNSFCQNPIGPVTAPNRPNMPGANRVTLSSVHHGCPSVGFDPAPFPVPPIALYGFRRQKDGSYAEPFVFYFNGGDGCFAPWGPSIHLNANGTYRVDLAFNDPRLANSPNNFAHIYSLNFNSATDLKLGDVTLNPGLTIANFALTQANILGSDMHRGNPFVYFIQDTPAVLFYDDETKPENQRYLYVSTWAGTQWNQPTEMKFPQFNSDGYGDTQPWFDGTELILRDGLQLLSYQYLGGPYENANSWGQPKTLLAPGVSSQAETLIVVGEPTIATIDNKKVLFFVYGIRRSDNSANLRVGYVEKNAN